MKLFKETKGYMKNKYVKDEHIFIPGKGCFFETKEKARNFYNKKPGAQNGVNFEFTSIIVEGLEVFNYHETNIYD